ncbi:high mobility group protein B3-like [Myxocyprinus asiaticus]|uniref:high mobility group protein B3-like n=1 Tax=Myxocyprinus asiaticus TaxID=70543 RepID=UPI0022215D62|nr:high mobility group protein B3-like [Myxocyprinus asiaticus]XP_051537256.1 high mobility group protein B3-like [Myxocyprinus asiaticus]XP_051537257.1 high mobility group protein B3-like [Myxocyprinus asiaticus]XP_051537258.1 high mobility group protein B3-like [Myxocyprinus asiaticus]XP_051537259.1 high mobility group protein B3-like [Myxocyprinus asiaticus]
MAKGDPGKPKGKMSAYAYFVKTCREEHNKKDPGVTVNFSEFSKKCSGRWKTMSPKEKTKFEDLAKQDKARYDQEMMHYNPGKKGKKQKKDPNAPRRPPSGFFLFCGEHRSSIKVQNPSLGIGDVAKRLGEMWSNLSDSEKQPFLSKANKLKDKYRKDLADYRGKGKGSGGASSAKSKPKDDDDDEEEEDEEEEEEDDDEDD